MERLVKLSDLMLVTRAMEESQRSLERRIEALEKLEYRIQALEHWTETGPPPKDVITKEFEQIPWEFQP